MRTKFIVTNASVLKKKYAGFSAVKAAINLLIAADKKRGIDTKLFDVSDAAAMKKVGGKAVTQPRNPKQNKHAIDAIYASAAPPPDYLMILGAVDVIPHQDLENPMFSSNDEDAHAWGDLPYACDAPYSTKIADFTSPTRVVGRLPDIDGAKDSAYVRRLLKNAAEWKPMPASAYQSYFAVSAKTWEKSTKMSVKKTFGSNANVFVSPVEGPTWTSDQLAPLSHFINCHGADGRSEFYGEHPKPAPGEERYPTAHQTLLVRNNIAAGTVAAVECCYGAQLYKPKKTIDPNHGICQEYLHDDAYGFFGSTTIAYGPADSNGAADVICAAFLRHVLDGSSLGLAALEARRDFLKAYPVMDPADLKTIAQFHLLGDPSIHPVAESAPKSKSKSTNAKAKLDDGNRSRREAIRKQVPKLAARTTTYGTSVQEESMDDGRASAAAAAATGMTPTSVKTVTADAPKGGEESPKALAAGSATPPRIYVVTGRPAGVDVLESVPMLDIKKGGKSNAPPPGTPPGFVVAMVREEADGSMKVFRKLFSK